MTPSNTPHRLAREATAAELAEEAKRLAKEYASAETAAFAVEDALDSDGRSREAWSDLCAAIDRLASLALPQLEEQQRWMPIAEAPKDGRSILVYSGRFVLEAWFSVVWDQFVDAKSGGTYMLNPTHWMPLPPPPTQDTTTQEAE